MLSRQISDLIHGGDEQVNDLFRDINDARTRSKEEQYFLGTVTLADGEDGRQAVIDGQQRLVTTSILIGAIRDYFEQKGQTQRSDSIAQEYLSKRDIRSQKETAYLHLAPEDRDFFLKRVVLPPSNPDKNIVATSNAQQRIDAAVNAAKAFIDNLVGTTREPDDLLIDILEYITDRTMIISVKVGDEANAFVIFEVLNDRGLDLTVADLLKNHIFRVSKDRLSEAQVAWQQMVTAITDIAEEKEIKGFIRQAWISENGLTREKELYDQIRRFVGRDKDKAVEYARHLSEQAVIYAALKNTSHARWDGYADAVTEALEVLENVRVTQIRPLLLAVFKHFEVREVNSALPMVVAWTVRFLVCGSGGSGTLEKYYADRAKAISTGVIKTAKQLFHAMKTALPADGTFKEAFAKATVTDSWLAKFYLRVLEQQNTKGAGEELIVNPDQGKVNLEHVLPQTATDDKWGQFNVDERKSYVKRVGNLALMQKKLNGKIGNADFATKLPFYIASVLSLTKEVGAETQWTTVEIEKRQSRLAELAVKAWPNEPQADA